MAGALFSGNWRQRLPVGIALALIAALPVLLLFSHRNTVTALALIGLATAFYPGAVSALRRIWQPRVILRPGPASVLVWLLFLCGFMGLSALWSPQPDRIDWAPRMAALILSIAGLIWLALNMASSRLALWILVTVTVVTALFLGLEGLTGGLLRDLLPKDGIKGKDIIASARGAGLALYLAVPALLALGSLAFIREKLGTMPARALQLIIVAGIALAALLLGGISANLLALAGGLAAAVLGFMFSRYAISALQVCAIGLFLFWAAVALLLPAQEALVAAEFIPTSWQMRLIAWRYSFDLLTADLWTFLFGGGIGFSRYLYEAGPTVELAVAPYTFHVMPTHPHNLFIHLWLEFGLVGILMVLAALSQAFQYLSRLTLTKAETGAVCALGIIFLTFASFETSLWTVWRFSTFGFALFGLVLIGRALRLES
ncbi:O-antigen ligase family protein [Parvularcula sp. IMCC14364]|uniref:O-antigen ligase family protein n=1 Tax=Parvularcula sp. IMCC14364 TaxID=3067902 RepID=UPI00274190C6|nr:O-antigen ligase family protein [Parvularcula sp. IMCC14364]